MLIRARSLRSAGRRRAGLFWGRQWAQADLDEKAIDALMADPVIEVELLDKPASGVPNVLEIQPRPVQPKAPVMFDDPRLRARQELLLKERAKFEEAQNAKRRGAQQPPHPKADLPTPSASEVVVKVEPKTETKAEAKAEKKPDESPKQNQSTHTGPKRS